MFLGSFSCQPSAVTGVRTLVETTLVRPWMRFAPPPTLRNVNSMSARPVAFEKEKRKKVRGTTRSSDFSYWAASLSRRKTHSFSSTERNGAARGPFSDPSKIR